jgi:adenylate cyclase
MKKIPNLLFLLFFIHAFFSVFVQGQQPGKNYLREIKNAKEDTAKVRLLFDYGIAIRESSKDSFLFYMFQALNLSHNINYKKANASILFMISTYHEGNGSLDSAILYMRYSLLAAKETKDSLSIGRAYGYLAYLQALISKSQPNLDTALIDIDSGICYLKNINWYLYKWALTRKAEFYFYSNKYDLAKKFMQEANKVNPVNNNQVFLPDPLILLGDIYIKTGHADSAKIIFRSLINYFDKDPSSNAVWLSYTYSRLADAYLHLFNYDSSIASGKTGLRIAVENHLIKERLDNLLELFEIYNSKKDFENALNYYTQHRELTDSLNASMLNSSAIRFTNQLKAERNKQQVILLKNENEKQRLLRNLFFGGFLTVLLFAGVFLWQRNRISKEKRRSEGLLLNILPYETAKELKETGKSDAKMFDEVTVMFTDFKGFTQIAEKLSPAELVAEIDKCFKAFDEIITTHNIEKIKTIGDSYMCAGGLPVPNRTNATDVINAAIEIRDFMLNGRSETDHSGFEIRIGIHTGPVVAGIVGIKKFAYDIWGDTVNIASRMESSGEAGKVNISGSTFQLVKDQFACTYRGKVQAKNKGEIDMYFVENNVSDEQFAATH